jgi:hypothetical protein
MRTPAAKFYAVVAMSKSRAAGTLTTSLPVRGLLFMVLFLLGVFGRVVWCGSDAMEAISSSEVGLVWRSRSCVIGIDLLELGEPADGLNLEGDIDEPARQRSRVTVQAAGVYRQRDDSSQGHQLVTA